MNKFNPNRLCATRARLGLSLTDFSARFGCKRSSLNYWERGTSQPPGDFIVSLAAQVGVDTDWFYEWDPEELEAMDEVEKARQLGDRVSQALQFLPLGGDALPLMLGATASDIIRSAELGNLDGDALWLIARMSGTRFGWLQRGAGEMLYPSSLGIQTYDRPIVSKIAAGIPILADQNITGWDSTSIPEVAFLFAVVGDSMIGANIMPGDQIGVALHNPLEDEIKEEDICVLLLTKPDDTEYRYLTLKYLRRTGAGPLLALSANQAHQPLILDETTTNAVRVLGVVREIRRTL